jgi:hypothetical protein
MTDIETTVCGIPCIVRVTYWEPYVPARLSGHPDNWAPAEGGDGDWEILDLKGRPAAWLERKMTDEDRSAINQEVFEHMENQDDYDY